MKQPALLVFVVITLLKTQYTEAHFKSRHMDPNLSSPLGFQQSSALSTFGQSDLKTTLAIQKTIAFMTILSSHPKLMCIVPPFLIVDFLTQLSCNPAILNAIPHNMLTGFMTSLTAVPTLANSIPQSLIVSISNTLSVGTPDATATGPADWPKPEILPTPLPGTSVSSEVAAVITPSVPSSGPAPNVPSISVTKDIAASISPAAPSSGPAPNLPGVSITKETTASITPPVIPSSGPASNVPGISVTKDITASISPISPSPVAPVLPADLPTTDGIPSNAYPPTVPLAPTVPVAPAVPLPPAGPLAPIEPSVPCIEVPAIGSPPALPELLPMPTPSLSPLSILSSFFNKGAGNSLLEAKIEAIFKLLTSGNLKLPQLHLPEVGGTLPTKPIIPVKPQPSQVFILLPAPLLGKPEISSAQATKLYYKPGSANQIFDLLHHRLFTTPQKLTLPKMNLPKLNIPKLSLPKSNPQYPVMPAQAGPIKCLPIFSKVPC